MFGRWLSAELEVTGAAILQGGQKEMKGGLEFWGTLEAQSSIGGCDGCKGGGFGVLGGKNHDDLPLFLSGMSSIC